MLKSKLYIYKSFLEEEVKFIYKVMSILFFSFVLFFLVKNTENYVYFFSLFVFFLYMIPALLNDPYTSKLGKLLSFIKYYPYDIKKFIFLHFIYRTFNIEQLFTYLFFIGVLFLNGESIYMVFYFFLYIFLAIFLTQLFEYISYYVKQSPKHQFLTQIFIVCLIFIIMQIQTTYSFVLFYNHFIREYIGAFLIIIVIIMTFLSYYTLMKFLTVKRNIIFDGIITKLIYKIIYSFIYFFTNFIFKKKINSSLVLWLIKGYLRDSSIIIKFGMVMLTSIIVSLISFTGDSFEGYEKFSKLAWLLGLFFFSEFRLNNILNKSKLLDFIPVPLKKFTYATDISGAILYIIFSILIFIVHSLIVGGSFIYFLSNVMFSFVFYLLGLCFKVSINLTKKERMFKQIVFVVISLVISLVISNLDKVFYILIPCAILINIYIVKVNKNQKD